MIMKNALVTGGAGFIGSNFVRYMLDKYPDYRIVNLDLLTYAGKIENLDDVKENENYTFEKGDIADAELVNGLFEKYDFDYVINFAAESHVDNSIKNPGILFRPMFWEHKSYLMLRRGVGKTGRMNKDIQPIEKVSSTYRFLRMKYMEPLVLQGCLLKRLRWLQTALTQQVKPVRICWYVLMVRHLSCL